MNNIQRLNKIELEFINNIDLDFHNAMKKIIEKINGKKIDDPKYWELNTKINKIQNQLDKLQGVIDAKTGGY